MRYKSNRWKMEYIRKTGRQLKIPMKELEAKVDFQKKSGKKNDMVFLKIQGALKYAYKHVLRG